MTLHESERIGIAHENMSTQDLRENLEEIAEELGYERSGTVDLFELYDEEGIFGALEELAEQSQKDVILDFVKDESFDEDIWPDHVIGGVVIEVKNQ